MGLDQQLYPKYDYRHYSANLTLPNNLLGESYLEDIIIYLSAVEDTEDLQRWCNQGIKLINYGDSPHIFLQWGHIRLN